MKKHLLFALFGFGISTFTMAQISEGGLPTSFAKVVFPESSIYDQTYQVHQLTKPDIDLAIVEDEENDGKGKPYRIGINIPVSYSINNSGTWLDLPNGDKIWRLGIRIPEAKALTLYFGAPVQIPYGGKLHAYNQRHSQYVGAYTANTPTFQAMEMVEGDFITLEYYMPYGSTTLPVIEINEVAYYYRGVEGRVAGFSDAPEITDERLHGSCQVDAMCSESTGMTNQRASTVHYSFVDGGTFVCTASVINNTAVDCKPYILSANHCGNPANNGDITGHIWYFNYQRPTCVPGNTATFPGALSQTMSGGTFRASSTLGIHPAGSGSQVDGCDFVLVELNTAIPAGYNAYYAGWSRSTTAATSGKCYHHPAGDEKKISTYSAPLTSATYNGGWANAHWDVNWVATTNGHGVTEGGSSGSGIYDQNGRIVGHLSGGSSFCATPTAADLYGKFNQAWTADGTTNSSQLEPWLDPGNTNAMTLDGTFSPCAPVAPTADFVASATNVTPATTVTFTDLSSGSPTSWAWVVAPAVGWVYAGGTNATSQNPQITFNTIGFYTITLTATNLQGSDGETKNNYIEVAASVGPCVSTSTQTCSAADEYISNVQFNTINNSSACSNYTNYPAVTTTVTKGLSYNLTVVPQIGGTVGSAYTNDEIAAWIDWNDDGDFVDVGENVAYVIVGTGWSNVFPITIPLTAVTGSVVMRVKMSYLPDDGTITPCGTEQWGETEDYVVNIVVSTGTAPVANFTADDTNVPTGTTVNFTDISTNTPTSWAWTIAPATGWSYVGGTNATSQNPKVNFTTIGNYTITLVATNVSGSDSEIKTNYIQVTAPTAIGENGIGSVSIYPNPTNGLLTIDLTNVNVDVESIQLLDVTGRAVTKATTINDKVVFNLTNEAPGIYFVKINTSEGTMTRKVIRQ